MTPAEIKKTRLYRTVAPCVRKEDREELARMLAMVPAGGSWRDFTRDSLIGGFVWGRTPQGGEYWKELSDRLRDAGHECW